MSTTLTKTSICDFIIIGAQRCGTTSMYQSIISHPEITFASRKELHFFDLNFKKGLDYYRSQFKDGTLRGEASPYYIFHPHVPKRIAQFIPKIKLIVMLRNPIDRAYSHYHHQVSMGIEKLSFEDALKAEEKRLAGEYEKILKSESYYSFNHQNFSYLSRGIYVDQLKKWRKFFDQEQILVIKSEDFFADPHKILNEVFDFQGLSKYNQIENKHYNMKNYKSMNNETRKNLIEYFKPHNEKLYNFLGRDFNWN